MLRRRHSIDGAARVPGWPADIHDWILSLPWVVERPYSFGMPRVRTFAVDCEPLGVRQLWLVTGIADGRGIAVVVPTGLANDLEVVGLVRSIVPMPAGHVLVRVSHDADSDAVETVVLEAYGSALSPEAC